MKKRRERIQAEGDVSEVNTKDELIGKQLTAVGNRRVGLDVGEKFEFVCNSGVLILQVASCPCCTRWFVQTWQPSRAICVVNDAFRALPTLPETSHKTCMGRPELG